MVQGLAVGAGATVSSAVERGVPPRPAAAAHLPWIEAREVQHKW